MLKQLGEIAGRAPVIDGSEHPAICKIIQGNTVDMLAAMPEETFQSCVTSPPYWGLRDYDIQGQIGAEPDLNEYIANLTGVFDQVRRVLRHDGTLWLNIGDS